MKVVHARNVSEALYLGINKLAQDGVWLESRAGRMIEMPCPVTTVYYQPTERVMFYPLRNANPFFHLMEGFWMLAGRNDVGWLTNFNKRMKEYSDDGFVLNGAYGYRWRNHFMHDQLKQAVSRLKKYENDRRTVVSMWDANNDLSTSNDSKDIPCNTQIYFKVRDGFLNMTVTCRSNDIIWGAYGANAVHFSMLHEYMAAMVGVRVGTYYHLSDSFHAYEEQFNKLKDMKCDWDSYLTLGPDRMRWDPLPMVTDPLSFDDEVQQFCLGDNVSKTRYYRNTFFSLVAEPIRHAWMLRKNGDTKEAVKALEMVPALDWRKACIEYIERNSK